MTYRSCPKLNDCMCTRQSAGVQSSAIGQFLVSVQSKDNYGPSSPETSAWSNLASEKVLCDNSHQFPGRSSFEIRRLCTWKNE